MDIDEDPSTIQDSADDESLCSASRSSTTSAPDTEIKKEEEEEEEEEVVRNPLLKFEYDRIDKDDDVNEKWDRDRLLDSLLQELRLRHIVKYLDWSPDERDWTPLLVYHEGVPKAVKFRIGKLLHAIRELQKKFQEAYQEKAPAGGITAQWLNAQTAVAVERTKEAIETEHGPEALSIEGFELALCGNPFWKVKLSYWANPAVTKEPLTIDSLTMISLATLRDGGIFAFQNAQEAEQLHGSRSFMRAVRKLALQVRKYLSNVESKCKDSTLNTGMPKNGKELLAGIAPPPPPPASTSNGSNKKPNPKPKSKAKSGKKRKSNHATELGSEAVDELVAPAAKRLKSTDLDEYSLSEPQLVPSTTSSAANEELEALEIASEPAPELVRSNSSNEGFEMMTKTTYYDTLLYASLAQGTGRDELPSHAEWLAALAPGLRYSDEIPFELEEIDNNWYL